MKSNNIRKSVKRLVTIVGGVTAIIITLQWVINNSQLADKLKKISIDFYIGSALTVLLYALQTWRDTQKEHTEFIELREDENRKIIDKEKDKLQDAIGVLENRIDSLIIQITALKAVQIENINLIKSLQDENKKLNNELKDFKYSVLDERSKILKSVHQEICTVYSEINYIKGTIEGTPISVDRLEDKLNNLANKLLESNERTDEQ